MPSDDRARRALDALAEGRERFRSAVAAAHDQMAAYVAAHRARSSGRAQAALKELGRFASGRIDAERFGALFGDTHLLTAEIAERVERLVGVLAALLAERDGLFTCDVPSGGSLRDVVNQTLAQAGRLFGAARAFQAVKAGMYRPDRHDPDVLAFPFAKWSRSERMLGISLVVEVDGGDLCAEELAGFVDGRLCLALVVRGPCAPAPLTRLITPGTLVMQASDAADLQKLHGYDGPAIAALVPDTAARFVHDPRAGRSLAERLTVSDMATEPAKHASGTRSAWQQREELAQLAELARGGPAAIPPPAANPAPSASAPVPLGSADARAVESLAAWLLAQAGIEATTATAEGALAP